MTTDQRPKDIAWFERLSFAAVAVGVAESSLTIGRAADGTYTNLDISVYVVFTIMAALIWLVAHRRSATAKWILVVLVGVTTAFWLMALPTTIAQAAAAVTIMGSLQFTLQVAGAVLLFTTPARLWMKAAPSPNRP